jgi:hypothetical protein
MVILRSILMRSFVFKCKPEHEGEKNLKKTLKMIIDVVFKDSETCSIKINKIMQCL